MARVKVRKAVIAAAGFGTRFLPQTKAMPKEMLPIVDKPIIQYIVEELVSAGIEDIIIVTGYHKRSIEDHFDEISGDLRANLEQGNKMELLAETEQISNLANFFYIRQKGPYGNGTPLLNAEPLIGDEPFIFTFADDFIEAEPARFQQMIDLFATHHVPILSAVPIQTDADYDRYGFASGVAIEPGLIEVKQFSEKPGKGQLPSHLVSLPTLSGVLLTPDYFPYLHTALQALQTGQEFYYNLALQRMVDDGHKILTYQIKNGRYCDMGNKLEYVKAVVAFALKHPEVKKEFRDYLHQVIQ